MKKVTAICEYIKLLTNKKVKDNYMKRLKKIMSGIVLFVLLVLAACSSKAKQNNYLASWTDNTFAKNKIFEYVKNVTDSKSPDFIPESERIAVFDMDGTIFCETDPVYYEYMMLFDRMFEDTEKNGGNEELVSEINEALRTGYISHEFELFLSDSEYKYYLNMTVEEYKKYIKEFLNKKTISYTNMLIKDALYKPMIEVINYLKDNNFTVYVVSGTERNFVRSVVCDKLGISERNVIGMDFKYKAKNQNNLRNSDYQYSRNEDIIVAGESIDVNVRFHKVHEISEEIGIVPVLAFGNSVSDGSMLEYTLGNEKYKSLAFMVICDDRERENGSPDKEKSVMEFSNEKGYITISMKNDWKTIYGDGVEMIKK